MKYAFLRYIGAKHRISKQIAEHLKATGKTCLCEVFGGSAAVMLNAGFKKRVYNDLDGDLVNLFRVLQIKSSRIRLLEILSYTPASREIFEEDRDLYMNSGLTFSRITDPVYRARATFYRHAYAFGGKVRSGGFQVSITGRAYIKEIAKYIDNLARLDFFGEFFFGTVIENLPFDRFISLYSKSSDAVLYVDPPYADIQNYYSIPFTNFDHVTLAHLCNTAACPIVLSAYDTPFVRSLYIEGIWKYYSITGTKNSSHFRGKHSNKEKSAELILTKGKEF